MLNYDWLLSGEAVDAVGTGKAGDASLKHPSWGWVTDWFQAGFQMHLDADAVLSSFYGVSYFLGACRVLPPEGGFLCRDLLEGWGSFQGPS